MWNVLVLRLLPVRLLPEHEEFTLVKALHEWAYHIAWFCLVQLALFLYSVFKPELSLAYYAVYMVSSLLEVLIWEAVFTGQPVTGAKWAGFFFGVAVFAWLGVTSPHTSLF